MLGPGAAEPGLLARASDAEGKVHDALLVSFPELHGKAVQCAGTALRVQRVRTALQVVSLRGLPLLQVLGYIQAAADASRHLSATIIDEALVALQSSLDGLAEGRVRAAESLALDPLPDHWAGKQLHLEPPPAAEAYSSAWNSWRPSWRRQRRTQQHGTRAGLGAWDQWVSQCGRDPWLDGDPWMGGCSSPQAAAWPHF